MSFVLSDLVELDADAEPTEAGREAVARSNMMTPEQTRDRRVLRVAWAKAEPCTPEVVDQVAAKITAVMGSCLASAIAAQPEHATVWALIVATIEHLRGARGTGSLGIFLSPSEEIVADLLPDPPLGPA